MQVSKKVEKMPSSGIRVFFDLVLGMKDVISLGVGEPDFVTPWGIREAAIFSIEQGYTSYTSNKGMPELRYEISKYLKRRYSLEYDPEDEILITVGVSEGVDLAFRAFLNPGDKVLIPMPCYVSYGPVVGMAGGVPVFINADNNDFKITPKIIKKYLDKKTKALLLNYPSNPTGVSYTKKELTEIAKFCMEHGLTVVTDEVYGDLTYDFDHVPFPTIKGTKDKTIYLNGFSKTYAMTGWRIGYACGPKEIIAAMTKIHQYIIMCVPIMSQMAAIEGIKNGQRSVEEMKREYKRRREFIVKGLNEIGLNCHMPQGAFYAWPSVKNTGMDSMSFAQELLKKEKVAVVPGTAFGPSYDDYIRISYASSMDNLKEALKRMRKFLLV